MLHYDYAIIGAGVVGSWIAFELSKHQHTVCVLEKENDCCMGSSKANSAIIHAGFDPKPTSLMAQLNVRGNQIVRNVYRKMAIPFKQVGSLVLALNNEDLDILNNLFVRGVLNKVPDLKILSAKETKQIEPNVSDACIGSLYAPTAGICSAFEMTCAPLELAVTNGCDYFRNYEVKTVEKTNDCFLINDSIVAKYVINAAGLFADVVANLFGDDTINIIPKKGQYSILDKSIGNLVSRVLFQVPTKKGKGVLVAPTVEGNILVGPNSELINQKTDTSTSFEGQDMIFSMAKKSVPFINRKEVITSFAGIRATSNSDDFNIGCSKVPGLINVAGICSPGLTSAPAIAEYVVKMLENKGLLNPLKEHYEDSRNIIRFESLNDNQKNKLIEKNPKYGRVVCRCETVTEGEIIQSIKRPAGAVDLDGVKRRTRAGMGRCQSGFCSTRVMQILSKELNIPYGDVTKNGKESWLTKNNIGDNNE